MTPPIDATSNRMSYTTYNGNVYGEIWIDFGCWLEMFCVCLTASFVFVLIDFGCWLEMFCVCLTVLFVFVLINMWHFGVYSIIYVYNALSTMSSSMLSQLEYWNTIVSKIKYLNSNAFKKYIGFNVLTMEISKKNVLIFPGPKKNRLFSYHWWVYVAIWGCYFFLVKQALWPLRWFYEPQLTQ